MEAIDYLRGKPSFYSKDAAISTIRNLTGVDPSPFYSELESSAFYQEMKRRNDYLIKNKLGNVPIDTEGKFLYALTRAAKPLKIVETGPGTGISSSFILRGLEDNKAGEMWSIEGGVLQISGLGLKFGQFVPDDLRQRWHLVMGESKVLLTNLLQEVKSIDIFFHDSDHSYENMMREFETAWPYIKPGGLMAADDINYNASFKDFCASKKVKPEPFSRFARFGIAKKSS